MKITPTTRRITCRATSTNTACECARPTRSSFVPDIGRQLCRDAILEHVDIETVQRYERRLARARKQLKQALAERIG
jgi:hypothetical protein